MLIKVEEFTKSIYPAKTLCTPKTHYELYQSGIIFTNAPYRSAFYHVEKMSSKDSRYTWHTNYNCPMLNVLSKHGITIEKVN